MEWTSTRKIIVDCCFRHKHMTDLWVRESVGDSPINHHCTADTGSHCDVYDIFDIPARAQDCLTEKRAVDVGIDYHIDVDLPLYEATYIRIYPSWFWRRAYASVGSHRRLKANGSKRAISFLLY